MLALIISGLGQASIPSWLRWCSVNQIESHPRLIAVNRDVAHLVDDLHVGLGVQLAMLRPPFRL